MLQLSSDESSFVWWYKNTAFYFLSCKSPICLVCFILVAFQVFGVTNEGPFFFFCATFRLVDSLASILGAQDLLLLILMCPLTPFLHQFQNVVNTYQKCICLFSRWITFVATRFFGPLLYLLIIDRKNRGIFFIYFKEDTIEINLFIT